MACRRPMTLPSWSWKTVSEELVSGPAEQTLAGNLL